MQVSMPKWLRRKTPADRAVNQIRDDEEALYEAEKRLELAAHEVVFLQARIARLKHRSAAHVVVQMTPHRR